MINSLISGGVYTETLEAVFGRDPRVAENTAQPTSVRAPAVRAPLRAGGCVSQKRGCASFLI